jgi:hypothetical protein
MPLPTEFYNLPDPNEPDALSILKCFVCGKEDACWIYKWMYPICIRCREERENDDLMLMQSKTETET